MKIELLKKGDVRLKQVCEEVVDFENKEYYQNLIKQIMEACVGQHAFAAAAPQFGINKRFVIMISPIEKNVKSVKELEEYEDNYEVTVYFNPRITEMKGLQYYYESCMSTGDAIGKVARPYHVGFDYQDMDGVWHYKDVYGFEAIVCCHEFDHLDGIEFVDKAEDLFYDVDIEQRLQIRNNNPRVVVSENMEFSQDGIKNEYKTKVYVR